MSHPKWWAPTPALFETQSLSPFDFFVRWAALKLLELLLSKSDGELCIQRFYFGLLWEELCFFVSRSRISEPVSSVFRLSCDYTHRLRLKRADLHGFFLFNAEQWWKSDETMKAIFKSENPWRKHYRPHFQKESLSKEWLAKWEEMKWVSMFVCVCVCVCVWRGMCEGKR